MDTKYKVVLFNTEGTGTDVEEQYLRKNKIDNIELIRIDGDNDQDFFDEAKDADATVSVYTTMDKENMSKLSECKIMVSHSIGLNQFSLKDATELGICVCNVPDYCIEEVAVHTVALALDASRKISQLDRSIRDGKWDIMAAGKMYRTKGRTYGMVSFGNIPRRISQLLKGFDMELVAYDPFVDDKVFADYGVKKVDSLEDLFKRCDFVSVHSPLNDKTYHMIGKAQFDVAKEGSSLISVGRGGVVNEDDLKDALLSKKVWCAGIDVIEDEENNKSVLKGLENVTLTPHVAYYSEDSCDEVREKAMMQIVEVLIQKKLPTYLANKDVDGMARFQTR